MSMTKELSPRGRRTRGAARNIRELKAEARRSGISYDAPPLPTPIPPERRTDWDFIAPKIKDLPNYSDIAPYLPAIQDFLETRRQVTFEGKDAFEASVEFDARHPELERDHTYDLLRPAFEIITGRFKQATNAMGSRRR